MKSTAPTGPTQPYRSLNQQASGLQPQGNYEGDSYRQPKSRNYSQTRQYGPKDYTPGARCAHCNAGGHTIQ